MSDATTDAAFDVTKLFGKGLPEPAPRWTGFPKYNFIGGHNDRTRIPVEALVERRDRGSAARGADSRPLQFRRPARLSRAARVRRRQARPAPRHQMLAGRRPDHLRLRPGHRPRQPAAARAGRHRHPRRIHLWRRDLTKFSGSASTSSAPRSTMTGCGSTRSPASLDDLEAQGHRAEIHLHDPDHPEPDRLDPAARAPRSDLLALDPQSRRAGLRGRVLCRPDLGRRGPPSLYAMDPRQVIHIGSFSKSLAPALRLGYVGRALAVMSRIVACKSRRRHRRARSDGRRRIFLAEFRRPCRRPDPHAAREARHDGRGGGARVRHRRRSVEAQGRHLSVAQAARPRST